MIYYFLTLTTLKVERCQVSCSLSIMYLFVILFKIDEMGVVELIDLKLDEKFVNEGG